MHFFKKSSISLTPTTRTRIVGTINTPVTVDDYTYIAITNVTKQSLIRKPSGREVDVAKKIALLRLSDDDIDLNTAALASVYIKIAPIDLLNMKEQLNDLPRRKRTVSQSRAMELVGFPLDW